MASYSNIQAGLTKGTKTCHDSQYSSQDSSQASHKHKSKPLQLELHLLSSVTDGEVKNFSIKVKLFVTIFSA